MNCCRILVTVHNDKVQEIWQVYEPIFRILISIGLQGNLQFKSVIKAFVACFSTLDLDLDSARIQLDTLGYTPMPSVSVKSCHLCFLDPTPPIFRRSLLTTHLQFALGRPGPLLYPGTCQYSACCGMRWWSIRITEDMSKPATLT